MDEQSHDENNGLSLLAGYELTPRGLYDVRPLAEMERVYIEAVINLCDGNISHAADLLMISPSTIYRKKSQW